MNAGQFVQVVGGFLGVGKVVRTTGDEVEVEYFDSISSTGRHRMVESRQRVKRVKLGLQRRCYWQDTTGWRVGRVVQRGNVGDYVVRPPDSDWDIPLKETELFVRWNRPIKDPIDVLVAHGNESPYFHTCREPFVTTITEQRAASQGMHGILSSVVELHQHQVEVARRVLEDPKQRYLLADEVGLGKTIEAGLIIRQYLLDHPNGHVVVITPPLLRRQWVSELREKFLIDDFGDAFISVLAHGDLDALGRGTHNARGRYSPHTDAGLVVIDEVHHIAALAGEEGETARPYELLANLAVGVPRLLLLSATPLLHNERTFLGMLHLLDPDVYPLDDYEGFRRRVQDRQALGTAFFTFRHDIPPFLLREKVTLLRGMFPDDVELGAHLDTVEESIGNVSTIRNAVAAARVHISETYRVHRRMLRTRRSGAALARFPVRGRRRPTLLAGCQPDLQAQDWLNEWRDYVRASLDEETPSNRNAARGALTALTARAVAHAPLLAAAARFRLTGTQAAACDAELDTVEQAALRGWAVDDTERQILERAVQLDADDNLVQALADFLRGERRKTVIFTSFASAAVFIHNALVKHFGDAAVASHIGTALPEDVEAELDRFRDKSGNCWILVCDRSAEEGRNLQFAEQAVHLDLPLSPNRLEQRIGRLDRYGRGAAIPTYALSWPPDTIAGAWWECLAGGFEVFDVSIASLQFAVDALLPEVLDALLDDGTLGLLRVTAILPERLAVERGAVAEQDALDAIEVASYSGELATSIDDLEDFWFQIQRATENLLCDEMGNLRFHRAVDRNDERYRSYRLIPPGKSPNLNSMPLVDWDVLLASFQPVVEQTGTYFRRAAMARPGARLFRVGEPLIDALNEYVEWDDRGKAFAFWRPVRRITDESLYFRFDYVVDADTNEAQRLLEEGPSGVDHRALQRRADAYLQPRLETIWTTLDGDQLEDEPVQMLLEAPYDPKRGDTNINHERRWALDQLVGEADWESRCRTTREYSERALKRRPSFQSLTASAAERFEAASNLNAIQRRVRLAFLTARERIREETELAADLEIAAALLRGIRQPRVRLDAVGVVVLAPTMPDGPGF
jgi:ATP-dependent helicase HepA